MSEKVINGYVLDGDLSTKNSGFAKWGFAKKDGKEYFIKEFLSPVYPIDESLFTPRMLEAKKKGCSIFQNDKSNLYGSINKSSDGNIVCVEDFFRCGGKYYITMEKINAVDFRPTEGFSIESKLLMCLLLTHSIAELHRNGVVHADLKWDNILFCFSENNMNFITKLIDFDNSFFIGNPPASYKEFQIDQVYCAPEAFLYSCGDERFTVDDKIDIFALGLIFHKILTKELPELDSTCKYAYEAAMDNKSIVISDSIDERIRSLILRMIAPYPKDRPSATEVYNELVDIVSWEAEKYPADDEAADKEDNDKAVRDVAAAEDAADKSEDETVKSEKTTDKDTASDKSDEPDVKDKADNPADGEKSDEVIKAAAPSGDISVAETETASVKDVKTTPVASGGTSKVKISGGLKFSSNLSYSSVQRDTTKKSIPGIDRKVNGEEYFSTPGDL